MGRGIECRNLVLLRRRGEGAGRIVLDGVQGVFPAGEVTLVTGAMAVGKSSLLHILAGLLRPSGGEVLADGEPVSRWISSHRDLWRRKVGLVFQRPNLLPRLTVLDNVLLPLLPRGCRMVELIQAGKAALESLGVLHLASENAAALSGGESQAAAVARALISDPDYLFADEPTSCQDEEGAQRILSLLSSAARDRRAAVVVASQDPRVIDALAAVRRYRLEGGRLQEPE